MWCLQFHSALLPLHSQPKIHRQQQQLGTAKLIYLSSNKQPTKFVTQRQHLPSLRTKAMQNDIVLGVTSPAKSGDISVLLQIGGVLFIAYLFSNFVVPILITKYFGFDKVGEEDEDEDDLFK